MSYKLDVPLQTTTPNAVFTATATIRFFGNSGVNIVILYYHYYYYYNTTTIIIIIINIISIGILLHPQRQVPRAIRSQMLVCDGHTPWKVNVVVVVAYTYNTYYTYLHGGIFIYTPKCII
jgi:hypothetical protein